MVKKILKLMLFLLSLLLTGLNCLKSKDPVSSTPGQGTWEIISEIGEGVNRLFFIDTKNGWAVGDSGKIKFTRSGGKTWSDQDSKTNSKLVSVYFMDQNRGFASGYNRTLIHTDNGGDTWENIVVQSDSATIYGSIHSDNSNNIYFISNYGEIFMSPDAGQTWDCTYQFNSWGYSYLYFPNNTTGFALRFHGSVLQKTSDGGLNWTLYQLPLSWTSVIFFLDERYGWFTENGALDDAVHDSSSVYFTSDGGKNWTYLSKLSGISLENMVFTDVNRGWMDQVTQIYCTNDGGKTWVCQFDNENLGYIKHIYFLDETYGWAVTGQGKIIKYSGS